MLIEHLPGEPTSFYVIPYNDPHPTQIKLTARNKDQKRLWAQHIKQVMLEHFDIPTRAKELVFKLGDEEGRFTIFLSLIMCSLLFISKLFQYFEILTTFKTHFLFSHFSTLILNNMCGFSKEK